VLFGIVLYKCHLAIFGLVASANGQLDRDLNQNHSKCSVTFLPKLLENF
jgi:hypothetical protein